MEERMTVCNMSIEAGARAGMIAPDDKTVDYLRGRRFVADRRGLRAGGRALARICAPTTARSFDKSVAFDAATIRAAGHLGNQSRDGGRGHRQGARPGEPRRARRSARRPSARWNTWDCSRARRSRISASTAFSSARAPTRGSSDLRAAADDRQADTKSPRACSAMVVPGSQQVKAAGRKLGLGSHLHGSRLRMARIRMQHVPGHEPGHPAAGRALREHLATATSKDARARAAARIWSAPRWPPRRRSAATSSTCASGGALAVSLKSAICARREEKITQDKTDDDKSRQGKPVGKQVETSARGPVGSLASRLPLGP